jgi:hypothetical protein
MIIPGRYKHFKGGEYYVEKKVWLLLPNSGESISAVVYRNKGGSSFCRYESDFDFEGVLSDGLSGKRFKFISSEPFVE